MTLGSEPAQRPARHAVAVYCASTTGVGQRYTALADQVGRSLGEHGWDLVWGGGNVSMMGAVARACRQAGGYTIGVIPQSMVEQERADLDSSELHVVSGMRERKALMDQRAGAFLTLPGGLGTCEELFEVWTSRYLGMHQKPVVLLDPDGHYRGLLEWVDQLPSRGFGSAAAVTALQRTITVDAALAACGPAPAQR